MILSSIPAPSSEAHHSSLHKRSASGREGKLGEEAGQTVWEGEQDVNSHQTERTQRQPLGLTVASKSQT
jgi:hypothetical protein